MNKWNTVNLISLKKLATFESPAFLTSLNLNLPQFSKADDQWFYEEQWDMSPCQKYNLSNMIQAWNTLKSFSFGNN